MTTYQLLVIPATCDVTYAPFSDTPSIMLGSKSHPSRHYLLKVDNKSTRARCEICLKLTIKTNGVVLVPLLLTLNIF